MKPPVPKVSLVSLYNIVGSINISFIDFSIFSSSNAARILATTDRSSLMSVFGFQKSYPEMEGNGRAAQILQ